MILGCVLFSLFFFVFTVLAPFLDLVIDILPLENHTEATIHLG